MYAKTLYKPEFPKHINKEIKEFTNKKLPHFFTYAKDKKADQVETANNSFVNKLDYKIKNIRINCRSIGLNKIDYRVLVNNPDVECKAVFEKNGKLNKDLSDPMIVKYCELNQKYHFKINMECADNINIELLGKSFVRQELYYQKIANEIRYELSQFGYSDSEIADILVKFLYYVKPSKHKSVLWFCYGKYIFENIEKHFKSHTKIVQCVDCGEWIEVQKDSKKNKCDKCISEQTKEVQCIDCGKWFKVSIFDSAKNKCDECYDAYRKKYKALKEKERRERLRGQTLCQN